MSKHCTAALKLINQLVWLC